MHTEAATMIPERGRQPDELRFYVEAVGGVHAVAQWLEVPQQRVRAWLVNAEPTPSDVLFWLDEAFGDLPAPSGEE